MGEDFFVMILLPFCNGTTSTGMILFSPKVGTMFQ
ncbi:hypothetical protein T12_16607 [Trichinella patagoniensis]|uniref:Uncharacterized protein n=1 Tax=Trichinella patagoniensis TaxID=990121 RepID=A0A0V0WFI9_9BILA|nr:hypothetical protein T12_16607 [Trichinella patagoniensis]